MEIIISEDFELTPAIKEAVHEKVEQVLEHIRDRYKEESPVKVFLSKNSGSEFKVQFKMHVKKRDISSHAESHDFYKSLNEAKQKIVRQINDLKEKNLTKRHH